MAPPLLIEGPWRTPLKRTHPALIVGLSWWKCSTNLLPKARRQMNLQSTHLLAHPPTHPPTHPLIQLLTRPPTHLPTHPPTRQHHAIIHPTPHPGLPLRGCACDFCMHIFSISVGGLALRLPAKPRRKVLRAARITPPFLVARLPCWQAMFLGPWRRRTTRLLPPLSGSLLLFDPLVDAVPSFVFLVDSQPDSGWIRRILILVPFNFN